MKAIRFLLICTASLAMTACNSVNFSPSAADFVEQQDPTTPLPLEPIQPIPPVQICHHGETAWVGAGVQEVDCSGTCDNGSRLRCIAQVEKRMVCHHGLEFVETTETRIVSVGEPITSCPINPPPHVATKMMSQNFSIPGEGKADILVVLDTTNSMSPELNKLARRFNNLSSSLGNVDWQIAVTNAGSTSGFFFRSHRHGKFFDFQDHPQKKRILRKGDAEVENYFFKTVGREDDAKLVNMSSDLSYCDFSPFCMMPNPKPLLSIANAIYQKDAHNAGFFRRDAHLVPIIISDADENENGGSDAYTPSQLINYYNTYLGNTMKGLVGFGIIIKPGDEACLSSNRNIFKNGAGGKYGTFVEDFANRTEGFTLSLCDKDFGPGLSQISERVRERVYTLHLEESPINAEVQVTVAPSVAGLEWRVKGKQIVFNKALPANAQVSVKYKALSK